MATIIFTERLCIPTFTPVAPVFAAVDVAADDSGVSVIAEFPFAADLFGAADSDSAGVVDYDVCRESVFCATRLSVCDISPADDAAALM